MASSPLEATTYPDIMARLDELGVLGDRAFLDAALGDFESGLREQMLALVEALSKSDRRRLERIAHRMAGSAMTLGASRLGIQAVEFERSAAQCTVDALGERVAAIQQEADQLLIWVGKMRQS